MIIRLLSKNTRAIPKSKKQYDMKKSKSVLIKMFLPPKNHPMKLSLERTWLEKLVKKWARHTFIPNANAFLGYPLCKRENTLSYLSSDNNVAKNAVVLVSTICVVVCDNRKVPRERNFGKGLWTSSLAFHWSEFQMF